MTMTTHINFTGAVLQMNVSALTAQEVLRMCLPETELEKRLFELVSELQDDLDFANIPSEPEYQDDYCDECDDKLSDIEDAIELIESGRVDDGVDKLKRIS